MRGHVVGALVPAVVLAVVAGSTAGAVTFFALSGAEVTEPSAVATTTDANVSDDGASDAGTDGDADVDGPGADADAADADASLASAEANGGPDDADESVGGEVVVPDAPQLAFEGTVEVHG